MKPRFDRIERKITQALLELDAKPGPLWKARRCTSEVKEALAQVGKALKYQAHYSNRRERAFEWLYDVCWLSMDGDLVTEMPVAVECEWGDSRKHILEDFQKLVVSNADHRILLCSRSSPRKWKDSLAYMKEQIQAYRGTRSGDRYLFGNWGLNYWEFDQYIHRGKLRKTVDRKPQT